MIMQYKEIITYVINQLELDRNYHVFYDADNGEWVIKPVEWNKMTDKLFDKEESMLEESRERDQKNKKKYKYIPDKIEIFSVNDMW